MMYGYTTVLLAIQPCLIQLFLLSYRWKPHLPKDGMVAWDSDNL